jgi:hypothetical protein
MRSSFRSPFFFSTDGLSDPDAFYAVYLDSTLLFEVKGLEGLEDADKRSRSTSHEICTNHERNQHPRNQPKDAETPLKP